MRAPFGFSISGSTPPTVAPLLVAIVPSVSRWHPKSLLTPPPSTAVARHPALSTRCFIYLVLASARGTK
eukprot:8129007-Pyramimonas_sp.AAC.1